MFTGETVTLTCDIRKGSGWRYSWMRKTKRPFDHWTSAHSTESQQRHILRSVNESDSGDYFCQGERGQNPVIHSFPGSLVLNVSGGKPKPVISHNAPSREMYTGESVTLSCGFGGDPAGWEYFWYKDRRRTALPNTENSRSEGSSYTISPAALAHSGEYRCIAARGSNRFYSDYSDPLSLDISALPKAQLTVQSGWTEVFPNETVTLRCVIQGSSAEWIYEWYRDGQELPVDEADSSSVNGDTYTILSADQSHTGPYTCRGKLTRRAVQSITSSPVNLNVLSIPQTQLTVQSGWTEVFRNETVTLRCIIQGSSAEWIYEWYRDGQELPVAEADSSSVNGDTYTILSADQSHNGPYTCRGKLTRRAVQSITSSPVNLNVLPLPKAQLTVQSGWTEVFTNETVTLRCVMQVRSTEWIYEWYRDGQELPVDEADSRSVNGDTYTILSADQSHTGLYTCSGKLQRDAVYSLISSAATLNVQAQPQAVMTLDNGWMEIFLIITEGSLTMRCELQGTSANWNYIWYRDGAPISVNHTGERHTVGFWNGSYDGEYKCQGNRTDRAYYSLISAGFMTTNIRLYFIVGVSGSVIIFISLVGLAVKCFKKCRKSVVQIKNQLDGEEFYSRLNGCYISADHGLPTDAVYEEIPLTTETEGSEAVIGQHCFYSAVQLTPLNQGPVL
ncbi:hypothetical protein COCON_G00148410 [Conger conger]|uniref:Ig-like domain-containing protein n=1 Tax=Conger conger TaxID=82655 RepID=A0A9Q1HUL9_CONCO|nr:hypothetical protein COCON_G00148410 [Conger conger]